MPNIKVHGLPRSGSFSLHGQIFAAIEAGAPELKEHAVVTFCADACLDSDHNPQPYLEISSTNPMETNTLVRILKPLGLDIETGVITGFYPKDK